MKLKLLKNSRKYITLLISIMMCLSIIPITANSEDKNDNLGNLQFDYTAIDNILNKINNEYGTSIHRVTPKEALEKYGIILEETECTTRTQEELFEFEKHMINIAENEIPEYNRITQEAIERAKELGIEISTHEEYLKTNKPLMPFTRAIGPISADKAIVYATPICALTRDYGADWKPS